MTMQQQMELFPQELKERPVWVLAVTSTPDEVRAEKDLPKSQWRFKAPMQLFGEAPILVDTKHGTNLDTFENVCKKVDWLNTNRVNLQTPNERWVMGHVVQAEDGWMVLDIDIKEHMLYSSNPVQQADFKTHLEQINGLLEMNECYVELSSSGEGLHILAPHNDPAQKYAGSPQGLELFNDVRFIIDTGNSVQRLRLDVVEDPVSGVLSVQPVDIVAGVNVPDNPADAARQIVTSYKNAILSSKVSAYNSKDDGIVVDIEADWLSSVEVPSERADAIVVKSIQGSSNWLSTVKPLWDTDPSTVDASAVDAELVNHIAFHSSSDEQVMRIHRLTKLGQREAVAGNANWIRKNGKLTIRKRLEDELARTLAEVNSPVSASFADNMMASYHEKKDLANAYTFNERDAGIAFEKGLTPHQQESLDTHAGSLISSMSEDAPLGNLAGILNIKLPPEVADYNARPTTVAGVYELYGNKYPDAPALHPELAQYFADNPHVDMTADGGDGGVSYTNWLQYAADAERSSPNYDALVSASTDPNSIITRTAFKDFKSKPFDNTVMGMLEKSVFLDHMKTRHASISRVSVLRAISRMVGFPYQNSGLPINSFLILLADSTSGKSGGAAAAKVLELSLCASQGIMTPYDYIEVDPVSGSALNKKTNKNPELCFGGSEFQGMVKRDNSGGIGNVTRKLFDGDAASLIYASDENEVTQSSTFNGVRFKVAPTMYGDSQPTSWNDMLSEPSFSELITNGWVGRLTIFPVEGDIPKNRNGVIAPLRDPALRAVLAEVWQRASNHSAKMKSQQTEALLVRTTPQVEELKLKLEKEQDKLIKDQNKLSSNTGVIYGRLLQVAVRNASQAAVLENHLDPILCPNEVKRCFVEALIGFESQATAINDGSIRVNENKALSIVENTVRNFALGRLVNRDTGSGKDPEGFQGAGFLRRGILTKVLYSIAFYKNNPNKIRVAKEAIQELVSNGVLIDCYYNDEFKNQLLEGYSTQPRSSGNIYKVCDKFLARARADGDA